MTTERNKITPCLWFDDQAEEAANFYTSIFSDSTGENKSKVTGITRYTADTPSNKPKGSILTVDFELYGQSFTALNGGPLFKFTPAISFIVNCESKEEVDALWQKLSEGGKTLMPLDSYPFSDWYGWTADKYGVSWQLILSDPEGDRRPKITPSLLFVGDKAGKAEEAIEFYTLTFSDSKIGNIYRYGPDQQPDEEGTIMYGDFTIEGQWFAAMDSAHEHLFNFNEAVSFMVSCKDQDEVDSYWEKLSSVPDSEQCGWLKDKYGVSWQIIPKAMPEMLRDSDAEKSERVMEAMLSMKKIDIEKLKQVYEKPTVVE